MANYSTLKAAVEAVVKTNGEQAITGANMQTVLLSIINSIGGGGYIFEGVATPSTNAGTPDQNVFYLAGAGTYANFGTSVIVPPTNIAVFKFNGSWVCEQVMVENGGVFDISAFKAVGGTLATYADLAAALGTGGANVPEGVRKGGMSVKFVLSSDNKYVQYRLMSDTFNTNGMNWVQVGVDTNYFLSDSIAPDTYYVLENGFYVNGTPQGSSNTWRRCKINISTASVLKFRTELYGDTVNCCVTDINGNVLKSWILADLPSDKFIVFDLTTLTKPYYFYYSAYITNFPVDNIYIKALPEVASLQALKDVETKLTGLLSVDCGELVAGIIQKSNAPTFTSGGDYRTTNYLPVSAGDRYVIKSQAGTGGYVVTAYSSLNQSSFVINASKLGEDSNTIKTYNVLIPSGVNYIRVTCERFALTDGKIEIYKVILDSIEPRVESLEGVLPIYLNCGVLINAKGGEQNSGGANYWASDFVPVNEGERYTFAHARGAWNCLITSFYSSNTQNSFIGVGLSGLTADNEYTVQFDIPKGASYMRICGSYGVQGPLYFELKKSDNNKRISTIESSLAKNNKTLLNFPRTSPRKPMVLFHMDMSNAAYGQSLIDYKDVLLTNGIQLSTYNVLPKFLGADAYKNFDMWMNQIYAFGNEVALHTDSDYSFRENSSLTPAQIYAAMVDYLDRLNAKGYQSTGFCPLGANLKPSFKPVVQKFCSWMLSGTDANPCDVNIWESNRNDFICNLQTSPYDLKRVAIESMAADYTAEKDAEYLGYAKSVVDATIESNGFVIFYGHSYNVLTESYTVREGVLVPLCEYIKTKLDNREIVTGNTNEMLEWYYTQRIGE